MRLRLKTRITVMTAAGVVVLFIAIGFVTAQAIAAVSAGNPEDEAVAIGIALKYVLLVAAMILAVGLAAAWYGTSQVVVPLQALARAAQRLQSGDLDTPLPDLGADEIGELGRDFENMRMRMRESRELLVRWNAEIENKVAQRTRQMIGLQESTRRLTDALALESTLGAIIEESRKLFGADRCAVFVAEPGSTKVSCILHYGLSRDYVDAVSHNYMVMPGGLARALAAPVQVPDALNDPRMNTVHEMVLREGFRSLVILPLTHHGQVTGAFALYHDEPRTYSPDDLMLGETFTAQASVALENARLFENEMRRARQLTLVGEIARQAAAALDAAQLLQTTADASAEAFDYYDITIVAFAAPGHTRPSHLARAGRALREPATQPWEYSPGVGIVAWVIQHGETITANDVSADARYLPYLPRTRSELCVPINDAAQVIGAINIESDHLNDFDAVEVATIEALASELAVALRNARLFAETRQRAEELAALFELSVDLQAAVDPGDIPGLALERSIQLTGASAGALLLFDEGRRHLTPAAMYAMTLPDVALPVDEFAAEFGAPDGCSCSENVTPGLRRSCPLLRYSLRADSACAACTCAPLRAGTQVLGLLHLQSHAQDDGTNGPSNMLRLIETISNQVAVALERARLADRLRLHAAGLEEEVAARTEEIRAQKESTEAILRSVGDGVFVIDRAGQVTLSNPMAHVWLRLAGQRLVTLAQRLSAAENASATEELEVDDCVLQANAAPVTENEQVVGTVVVLRDITRLRELDRLKSQFISNLTHELRTPLTNIKLYLNLLNKRGADGLAKYLPVLTREANRLQELIEGLLAISRMEQGKVEPEYARVDLGALAAQLVSDRQALAGERGLSLSCESGEGCPPVEADAGMISQVASNLITNALYYTPAGGNVNVEVRPAGEPGWVLLSVQDSGLGIAPEEIPHLFERFYRGKSSRETGAPGTGLGLAICKEIVDRHGGRIQVSSEPARGSTFSVWLRQA